MRPPARGLVIYWKIPAATGLKYRAFVLSPAGVWLTPELGTPAFRRLGEAAEIGTHDRFMETASWRRSTLWWPTRLIEAIDWHDRKGELSLTADSEVFILPIPNRQRGVKVHDDLNKVMVRLKKAHHLPPDQG